MQGKLWFGRVDQKFDRLDCSQGRLKVFGCVTTLLLNPKGLVEQSNPNICTEAKLCLFLFMSTLEIVCRETEVLIIVGPG